MSDYEESGPSSEIQALEEENRALKAKLASFDDARVNAGRYQRRIDALMRKGMPRAKATAQASREMPQCRRDFLLLTNSRLVADDIKKAAKMPKRPRGK
jgi:cell division septum initiation protein DivIVA